MISMIFMSIRLDCLANIYTIQKEMRKNTFFGYGLVFTLEEKREGMEHHNRLIA
jgi:hypothetical protein